MKKAIAAALAALTLFAALPAAASPNGIVENPVTEVRRAAPDIDGVIGGNEGWSDPLYFDYDTVGFFWRFLPLTTDGKCCFAYGEEGLYFAAVVHEHDHIVAADQNGVYQEFSGNGLVVSDGFDVGNEAHGGGSYDEKIYEYGWNGDVITLMIDPGSLIRDVGMGWGDRRYTPWYSFGVFRGEDGGEYLRVYASHSSYKEITDSVRSAVSIIDDGYGWEIEALIPWDIIVEDVNRLLASHKYDVSVDSLTTEGTVIKAGMMYMDRYVDADLGETETWGRYVTVCDKCSDGSSGYSTSGPIAKALGLTLKVGGDAYIHSFTDVPDVCWYASGVTFCGMRGYMTGTSESTFEPEIPVTRAMMVQILAKIDDADLDAYGESIFIDVPAGAWYTPAVEWAYLSGYAYGVGDGMFAPEAPVTREQVALFLYNYARKKGCDVSGAADLDPYEDASSVSDWARAAVEWAVDTDMISGVSETLLAPLGYTTRSQLALIVRKFVIAVES